MMNVADNAVITLFIAGIVVLVLWLAFKVVALASVGLADGEM